jgi:predicted ATPase
MIHRHSNRHPMVPAGRPEQPGQVPSLSPTDEAIELFTARARQVRPDFALPTTWPPSRRKRRLDGVPLAIELAAARVRVLSLHEIRHSLHDRFRLLTGGARTAVRRQQTLRASVDWSPALLTEPERILFARLAVFMGRFDLEAAEAVAGGGDVERYQVLAGDHVQRPTLRISAESCVESPAWKSALATRSPGS